MIYYVRAIQKLVQCGSLVAFKNSHKMATVNGMHTTVSAAVDSKQYVYYNQRCSRQ